MLTEEQKAQVLVDYTTHLMDAGFIFLPITCPACKQRIQNKTNNKEICDSCFLLEAYQRLLHDMRPNEDLRNFANWFIEHINKDDEEWG